jgi:hypothetical protein
MTITINTLISSPDKFLKTYDDEAKGLQQLNRLQDAGIFPLTIDSTYFAPLNVLGLYTYFTGTLNNRGGQYSGMIVRGASRPISPPLKELSAALNIDFRNRDHQIVMGRNGSMYARLLYSMGFDLTSPCVDGACRKAMKGSSLPQYICEAVSTKHGRRMSQIVAKMSRDIVNVWVDTKTILSDFWHVAVAIPSQPSREQALSQAQILADITSLAYPKIKINLDQLRLSESTRVDRPNMFSGYFNLTKEQVVEMSQYNSAPLRAKVCVNPHYSFNASRSRLRIKGR